MRNTDYTTAVQLNLEALTAFLVSRGYSVVSLEQPWRHAIGRLKRDGMHLWCKVASTPGIGERTRNEITWNECMTAKLAEHTALGITVPRVLDAGSYEGLPYYITEEYAGPLLAEKGNAEPTTLQRRLPLLVRFLHWLHALPLPGLSHDDNLPSAQERVQILHEKFAQWRNAVGGQDLDDLLATARTLTADAPTGTNHGDFVPWHCIVQHPHRSY